MKLTELNPRWYAGGYGLSFDCPCGRGSECQVFVAFENPLDGSERKPGFHAYWRREGDSFESLTLSPSILNQLCGWHGWLRKGELCSV